MKKNKGFIFLMLCFSCYNFAADFQGRVLGSANWGTHMTPLLTAVLSTDGPVLELGCGDFSTTILHAVCAHKKRFLLTVESEKKWMDFFSDLKRDWHLFKYVSSFDEWDNVGNDVYWGVVFVDHSPARRRRIDINRLKGRVDVFVVHDTEDIRYEYEPVFSTFKYRYVYKRYRHETTLLSDTIDVNEFFVN